MKPSDMFVVLRITEETTMINDETRRKLREMSMEEMITKKGIADVVKKTVDGMIPRNKLRAPRMKNLIVNE